MSLRYQDIIKNIAPQIIASQAPSSYELNLPRYAVMNLQEACKILQRQITLLIGMLKELRIVSYSDFNAKKIAVENQKALLEKIGELYPQLESLIFLNDTHLSQVLLSSMHHHVINNSAFQSLKKLRIEPVSNEELQHIGCLQSLEELYIECDGPITLNSLSCLKKLKKITINTLFPVFEKNSDICLSSQDTSFFNGLIELVIISALKRDLTTMMSQLTGLRTVECISRCAQDVISV